MQHNIAPNPELLANLEHLGIAAALDGYIDPQLVRRWGFLDVERFVQEHGYRFVREHGNVYGRVALTPIVPQAVPVFRVITRSDVAAVHAPHRAA